MNSDKNQNSNVIIFVRTVLRTEETARRLVWVWCQSKSFFIGKAREDPNLCEQLRRLCSHRHR
eukprot:945966-Amphidinium_carterae.1